MNTSSLASTWCGIHPLFLEEWSFHPDWHVLHPIFIRRVVVFIQSERALLLLAIVAFSAIAASSLFCERCEISRCRFGACLLSGSSGGRKFPVALIVLKRKASDFWWRKSLVVLDPSVESRTTSKAAAVVVFTKSTRTNLCTAFERVVMKWK